MRKKSISKMSKADITKLRQEVESGEVTTREIANKWRLNFSELMSWCKRLGLRYNTVKPKNDIPLPIMPQQEEEVQVPVENVISQQKAKSAKGQISKRRNCYSEGFERKDSWHFRRIFDCKHSLGNFV